MAGADTSEGRKRTGRRLRVAAVVLWVVAIALVATYAVERSHSHAVAEDLTDAKTTAALSSVAQTTTSSSTSTTLRPTAEASAAASATTTSTSESTSTTAAPALTVAAGGDVQGDRMVGKYIDAHGGPAVFAKVAPYLHTADLAFINLEGPVSDKGTKASWKEYTFRSRLALIDGLTSAGIDVVSTANNHAADCGTAAVLDTVARLDEAGIKHAGSGKDATAAREQAILKTTAGKVAVLAFTDKHAAGFAASAGHPGVAVIGDGSKVIEAIRAAKKKADYVIVSFHWGIEYEATAAAYQRTLAHKCIDAGADLILGHHPHVIQGIEVYKDKLIAYSLGDFVFDHRPGVTGQAFVLRVTLHKSGPPVARVIPVYLDNTYGIPAPVTGSTANTILTRLTKLSSALGTTLTRSGDQAWFGQSSDSKDSAAQ